MTLEMSLDAKNSLDFLQGNLRIAPQSVSTREDILRDYEDLERADVSAALAFAARLAQVKRVQPPAA